MQPSPLTDYETIASEFKDFAYIVSHDLSGPLRAMVEFSRLLKSEHAKVLDEEGALYLSLIVESGEKMQKMLAGLLDYSRLNTMGKPLVAVDFNVIIENCQTVLQDKIKSTKATFEIATLPTVEADIDQMMQLFGALIDNALKYQPEKQTPHIVISANKEKNGWRFTVKDNGIGIEQEFQERIFKPFQRLHTPEEYPGIGMGLALAKKIVGRHRGTIGVESSPREGSSFYFTLGG